MYKIIITRLVEYKDLDHDDRSFMGYDKKRTLIINASDVVQALDDFHSTYAIACLDDFDIDIELVKDK